MLDHYAADDFKFVTLDAAAGQVLVGHRIKNRWVVDAGFGASIVAGAAHRLAVSLFGTTVTVRLDGISVGSFSYYGAVADGDIGAISRSGTTSFDDVRVEIGTRVSSSPTRWRRS